MDKKNIKDAVEKYIIKNDPSLNYKKDKKIYKKPEKEVERQVRQWLSSQNIFAFVVESKAVFSKSAGRYLYGQCDAGFPDIVCVDPQGLFLAIELKAPGRRSSLRPSQRLFLNRVISNNGFACVVDSVSRIESLYYSWKNAPLNEKKNILINDIPKERASNKIIDF